MTTNYGRFESFDEMESYNNTRYGDANEAFGKFKSDFVAKLTPIQREEVLLNWKALMENETDTKRYVTKQLAEYSNRFTELRDIDDQLRRLGR